MQGYYRYPTVCGDRVVFVSEDDLWEVPLAGGLARRLTHSSGQISFPAYSPDGRWLAYTGTEEGATEVFLMDARSGQPKRLTFDGVLAHVIGFSPDSQRVIFSSQRRSHRRGRALFEVEVGGSDPRPLALGDAIWLAQDPRGPGLALGRHNQDLSRWKRYRGGLAGVVWVDPTGQGQWRRLFDQETAGFVRPLWARGRLWLISDRDGYGNVYSCLPDGDDLTRHTHHTDHDARHLATDGDTLVFACGGDLHALDLDTMTERVLDIHYRSPREHVRRRFVHAEQYLEEFSLHPRGHYMAVAARGKAYTFGLWEGAVRQSGQEQGVRYDVPRYLRDGKRLVMVSDEGGEPRLEIHTADGSAPAQVLELAPGALGRPLDMHVSPTQDAVALLNHRYELVHVDLTTATARVLDRCQRARLQGMSWSRDGRWIAYSKHTGPHTQAIFVYDLREDASHQLTEGAFKDSEPCFDPEGRYLYFISYRDFSATYGSMFFELGFQAGGRPYLLTLRAQEPSPLLRLPRPLDADEDEDEKDEKDEKDEDNPKKSSGEDSKDVDDASDEDSEGGEDGEGDEDDDGDAPRKDDPKTRAPKPVEIDLEGISRRILALPVPEGRITALAANSKRVFYTVAHLEGASPGGDDDEDEDEDEPLTTLRYFDLKRLKNKFFAHNVGSFELSADGKTLAMSTPEGLRVVSALDAAPSEDESATTREAGWIDLSRVQIEVDVRAEWGQMLREIWRLMRDHFWDPQMSGLDWPAILRRYEPLLDRVGSRDEFSDLVWCMQGELGTSHAYEFGGDYRPSPSYRPGLLGADITWHPELTLPGRDAQGGYRIDRILRADHWSAQAGSPLVRPGLDVREGDVILAINGRPLTRERGLHERLLRQGGQEVELVVLRPDTQELKTHTVRALHSEAELRYRDWVEARRALVHQRSLGRVGYLHIPDMGSAGYAEFHRGFMAELHKDALIIDVRYNGGGHVSQLLLDKLRRQVVGYDLQRHGLPISYPTEAPLGPLIALTNEYAGSDGDIFSHCFKLYGLGPLVGKRTWGGVIGIWPRHALVDGSITTQPEFSFWFHDVGFGVENYGTEPDLHVETPPQAEDRGQDPQLEAAITLALEAAKARGASLPDFGPKPDRAPPKPR